RRARNLCRCGELRQAAVRTARCKDGWAGTGERRVTSRARPPSNCPDGEKQYERTDNKRCVGRQEKRDDEDNRRDDQADSSFAEAAPRDGELQIGSEWPVSHAISVIRL